MKPRLPAKGRCLCETVQFECDTLPIWSLYCHCESCRLNTGSPVTAFFGIANGNWRWLGTRPQVYESQPGVRRHFCNNCGTPVAYDADKFPGEIHFYTSALYEKAGFEPKGHVHATEKLPWHDIKDELPRWAGTMGKVQITD